MAESAPVQESSSVPSSNQTGGAIDPFHVLVVGADSCLSHLREHLEAAGLAIAAAASLTEALARIAEHPLAAVVVSIPDADPGHLDVLRAVRQAPRSRTTPILVLGPEDPDSHWLTVAYELGAVDYLSSSTRPAVVAAKALGAAALFREAARSSRVAEQMRMMVQGTLDYAIFMLDPEGRVASWNAGARLLKGYEEEEIRGQHLSLFYPPEVVQTGWVEHELRVAASAGRFEDEGWRVRKDGTRFWANVVITALRDEDGQLRGFAKVTRDLTSRKQAEETARQLAQESAARRAAESHASQLAEQRERLRVTLASIGDAVISTDRSGRVQFMNPIAERLCGWTFGEALGLPLTDIFRIINETTRLTVENPALKALESGHVVGLANHTLLVSRDGVERHIDDSAAPIRDDAGHVVGSVLVFRDIGAQRRKERQRNARAAAIQVLATAASQEGGTLGVLATLCEHMEWKVGLFWALGGSGSSLAAHCRWAADEARTDAFLQESRALTLGRGQGLPGRVWDSGAPAWVSDLEHDDNLPRARTAVEAGLRSAFACPVGVGDAFLGVIEFFSDRHEEHDSDLLEMAETVAGALGHFLQHARAEEALRHQTANAEALVRIATLLGEEKDLHRLVQFVTDEATQLCGARFGAFFYNVVDDAGESFKLYTLSGIANEAFEGFPMPRNTEVFGPTFSGRDIVRIDDLARDPRYGKSAPYHGLPQGHPPVRSYLAASVVSQTGEVHGGLFFGHPEAGVFTERHERLLRGIAGQAAVAMDNARMFKSAQDSAERLNLALNAAELGDWSWDTASDVLNMSERAAVVFGIRPGSSTTWTALQQSLHPDDSERVRAEVERVVAQREPYNIEYRIVRGGRIAWVGALGRAIYDDAGQPIGMYGVVQDISQRKRLEQSLSDSEARFRSLMEQAPFSIQVISPDGRTERVNRSWEVLWGATLDQIGDYNILQDRQLEQRGVLPLIQQAFDGTPAYIPAIRYDPAETLPDLPHAENPARWVAAVAYPIKDEAGNLQQVVLVHDDVTARMRAETALRESEERLRLALEAGQMGVWDWNIVTGSLEWSDTLEPLHGLAAGEFGGTFEAFQALIHPEDRARVGDAISDALEKQGWFYTEFRNAPRERGVRWIAGSGKVFTDDSGKPVRMIGIGLDVTQRKRSEQSAQLLSAASAALAEIGDFESTFQKVAAISVPTFADWFAVDMLDHDLGVRRVVLARFDGTCARIDQGQHPHGRGLPTVLEGTLSAMRTGKPQLVRDLEPPLCPDAALAQGTGCYIAVPLSARGGVRGALTFGMAESGRGYEQSDLDLAMDLARRAGVAIENAELYGELRQADRHKDEFLATLAHELRNPLAPISTGLKVIRLSKTSQPQVEQALAMMERQMGQLVRLVDDLLDLSRITRNKLELRKEVVELADVVRSAAETSQPLVDASGNSLTIELPSTPVVLMGDRVRLAQVFANLLNNAAKYSPNGGRIRLAAEQTQNEVIVRISDTGFGIPAESLAVIFEMFRQVHKDVRNAQAGLGIGLTLVKRLVELHDGSVEARSDGPGRGSEFTVRLPLQPQAALPAQIPADAPRPKPEAPCRILVVDDNVDAAQTLAMMLTLLGHEVRVGYAGHQAIELSQSFRPQLVLLDIGLPDLSGHEVCRAMRTEAATRGALIVALTGWGKDEDRRRSGEAGFDDHLVKPIELDQLLPLISRAGAESRTDGGAR